MQRNLGYFVYVLMAVIGFLILHNSTLLGQTSARNSHTEVRYKMGVRNETYSGYSPSELDQHVRTWQIIGGILFGLGLFWAIAPVTIVKRPNLRLE